MKIIFHRNMSFSNAAVSTWRKAALVPEVATAIAAWVKSRIKGEPAPGVLIGGLAMSFYAKPRVTTDVDLLFLSQEDIPPQVNGFKRNRPHSFQEKSTHVEVEIVTAQTINVPLGLVRKVIQTAVTIDGLNVASREAMIALKLYGADDRKRELNDLADVVRLLEQDPNVPIDQHEWFLTDQHCLKLQDARTRAV